MTRESPPRRLDQGLAVGLFATLLLPIVVAILAGLAGLLTAVGDPTAAAACRYVALGIGVQWLAAVVGTTALSAVAALAPPRARKRRRRRRRLEDGAP